MLIDPKTNGGVPETGARPGAQGLERHGLRNLNVVYWNLGAAQLLEHAVRRGEGAFAGQRRIRGADRPVYRPLAQGQVRGSRRGDRGQCAMGPP